MKKPNMSYEDFRRALRGHKLPCAFVNLDAVDKNIEVFFDSVRGAGKTIRIATKSVRCPRILDYIKEKDDANLVRGFMCYTPSEAAFLAENGYDDLLVAYPSVQPADLKLMARMTAEEVNVSLVIDSTEHLDIMGEVGRKTGLTLKAVIELDVAYSPLFGRLYFGVRRSPVRNEEQVIRLIRHAEKTGGVKVAGIMAYEAQVAGLNDESPYTRMLNPIKRWIKKNSVPDVLERRNRVWRALQKQGIELEFINGGGSGSVRSTSADPAVTEVTVGSGFYTSHLFRYYRNLPLEPAAFFATQVVRKPIPGMITCQGGGYIASGPAGDDRLPMPYSPEGAQMLGMEGAGEVQTPLTLPADAPEIHLGDPVIWQHAKAGELMERFNELLLMREGMIEDRALTYRGLGKCFL